MTIKRHTTAKKKQKTTTEGSLISVKAHEVTTKRDTETTDAQNDNKEMDSDK